MNLRSTDNSKSRFAAYVEGLVGVIGHADRAGPLRDYCLGLIMPCERSSPVKKSRFGQATSDATAMISAATSASNTAMITTVIASAVNDEQEGGSDNRSLLWGFRLRTAHASEFRDCDLRHGRNPLGDRGRPRCRDW